MSAAKAAARTAADELHAKILALEAAASPDELRAFLADTRQMLLTKDQENRQLKATLADLGGKFSAVLMAHIQCKGAEVLNLLDRIVAKNCVVMKNGVAVPPAGERMQ